MFRESLSSASLGSLCLWSACSHCAPLGRGSQFLSNNSKIPADCYLYIPSCDSLVLIISCLSSLVTTLGGPGKKQRTWRGLYPGEPCRILLGLSPAFPLILLSAEWDKTGDKVLDRDVNYKFCRGTQFWAACFFLSPQITCDMQSFFFLQFENFVKTLFRVYKSEIVVS